MHACRAPAARAVAGALALALAVGVGRFAYTPLLPALQRALDFGDAIAGTIASANLLGYMVGAAWARTASPGRSRVSLLRLGLAGSVLTTSLVVTTTSGSAWAALRFAAGVASGLVFVLVSAAVLESLPSAASALGGLLYAGVGAGIVLSGVTARAIPAPMGWRAPWLVLAVASALLAVPAWVSLVRPAAGGTRITTPGRGADLTLGTLTAAYFLEGLGYIVSGTFVVSAVQRMPGMQGWGAWVWVAVGLAAAPSPLFWMALNRWRGPRFSLLVAFVAQAMGMALPAVSSSRVAIAVGALLFGGTFMGIATVTLAAGRVLAPGRGERAIGMLTVVYGVGQVLGPVLAGLMSERLGDPRPAALAASTAVALGAVVLACRPARRGEPRVS